MAHSFVNNNLHCVFSTRERQNLIRPEFQEHLWKLIVSVLGYNTPPGWGCVSSLLSLSCTYESQIVNGELFES